MRLAVIMYGHMRTYDRCFSSFKKNLMDIYSPDIFIHTWDEIEAKTKSWHDQHMSPRKIEKYELNYIKECYGPITMRMETQNPDLTIDAIGANGISFQGQKFMLYSLNRADNLRIDHEKYLGKKYDMVLKIRPDIDLVNKLNIWQTSKDIFVISARKFGKDKSINSHSVCDIVNFADSDCMTKVTRILDSFDQFYLRKKNEVHSPWIDYILSCGITIDFSPQIYGKTGSFDWGIIRKEGYA